MSADNFWPTVVANIEQQMTELRGSREYRHNVAWFRAQNIDIEQVLTTDEGRMGFRAGLLYAKCQQQYATLPKEGSPT